MTSLETLYTKNVTNEHTVWSLRIVEVRFQCWTDSGQTGYTGAWSGFGATRCAKHAGV
jgi:hypothetical protein